MTADKQCGRCGGTGRESLNGTDEETLAALRTPMTVKALAEVLDLPVNTIHQRVERMRSRGLVHRSPQSGRAGALYGAR